ncbi:MAG TPA: hypothetical protein VIJ19_09095 [Opitutaceae bacterium]
MVGYSGTPLWKKLGYKDCTAAYADGAPSGYVKLLALPKEIRVTWLAKAGVGTEFVHLFSRSAAELKAKLKAYRKSIAPHGVVWVSWPKKSSGVATDITEDAIRDVALPTGLVDIKVCAVDETWSGLKLMIRKELR